MGTPWSTLGNNEELNREKNELQDKLIRMQSQIEELNREKNELQEKLIAEKKENKELRDQNKELRENRVSLESPWRELKYKGFTDDAKSHLYEDIESVVLPDKCEAINLIVMGDTGSGKSSFVNTLKTVFRDNDHIANVAPSYGTNFPSTTRRLHEITLKSFDSGQKLMINDCRGIPKDVTERDICESDLKNTINGHIKKNYEFKADRAIQKNDGLYRENPTISEKMHCVLFVVNADMLDIERTYLTLKNIQGYLHDNNDIPLQIILTKMDKLDLCGLSDCSGIFYSRHASKKMQLAKTIFGVKGNQIQPIANYVDETRRSNIKDILALQAILNILQEAVTYIENI